MSLFVCERCTAVENTALASYFSRSLAKKPLICSECLTGTWHDRFPKVLHDAKKHGDFDSGSRLLKSKSVTE